VAGLALLLGAALLLRPGAGTVHVEVDDPLRVSIDGRALTADDLRAPLRLEAGGHTLTVEHGGQEVRPGQAVRLDAGEHRLVVRLGGEEVTGEHFIVPKGEEVVLHVRLDKVGEPRSPEQPPPRDRLTLRVIVKTGLGKQAGGKAPLLVIPNGDTRHLRLVQPTYVPGTTSQFDLDYDLRPEDVRTIALVYRGQNAWRCESVEFQFLRDGRLLARHPFEVSAWFSSEPKAVKKLKARTARVFEIPREPGR
jgi:hypothetical protein